MPRAFSYERVSSPEQARSGSGLGRQGASAAAWCRANGLLLDDQLTLRDPGLSAYKGHHLTKGALGQFLELAKGGRLGDDPVLLVEAIDRLSRQEPLDAIETILQGLVGSGVRIITLEDGAEYSRATLRTDPTRLIVLVVKVQAAHEFSARLSMRMRGAHARIRADATAGERRVAVRTPFWIDYDPATDTHQLNAHARIVERFYELMEAGNGVNLTARKLNEEGIFKPDGSPWKRDHLTGLAKSELPCGTIRFLRRSKEPIKIRNYFPAVVTQERFERLQRLMRERAKDPSFKGRRSITRWIGQGITTCTCGATVTCTSAPSRSKSGSPPKTWLFCRASKDYNGVPGACRQRMLKMLPMVAHVLTRLSAEQLAPLFDDGAKVESELRQELKARDQLEQQLAAVQERHHAASERVKEAAKAGSELSLLQLLNDAAQEEASRISEISNALEATLARIDQIQQRPGPGQLAKQLGPAVQELLGSFADGTDTPKQRFALNTQLRTLGLRIHVDAASRRCGLQLRDGPIHWQPVVDSVDTAYLRQGITSVIVREEGGLLVEEQIAMPGQAPEPVQFRRAT